MNSQITPFDTNNFSQLVDFVKDMWTFSQWEEYFRKFYAEIILRNNFFENNLTFQIAEKHNATTSEKLNSVIFFQKKADTNNINQWILENSNTFNESQKESTKLCIEYLSYMDSKVHSLMNDDDIKLSLFVSCKKGFGSIIFEELWNYLKEQNYKNMYLWTDCECNWKWYIKNGFTLIEESSYEKFSNNNKKYTTYIFKKTIS